MKTNRLYLDYNATAPMRPEVLALVTDIMARPHNASAVHAEGRAGRALIERARAQVAALVGAPAEQVIFNSGATEANNTVLKHFANERVLVSVIEHPAVLDVLPKAEKVPATSDGIVDLNALEDMLQMEPRAGLVSVMMVNNETGVIQPVKEIAALAKKYGALFHCDAVQAAGRIPINISEQQIDFLSLSAHKIGGPQGVGALVLGLCGITPTLLDGGGQEKKARAGTESVAGISGFGMAAEMALAHMTAETERLQALQKKLEDSLKATTPDIKIYGEKAKRVKNTTLMSLSGTKSDAMLMNFDLEGIAVSNGSACTSGSVQPSHVLKAMGADDVEAMSGLRVSMGWATQDSDIERFLAVWEKISAHIKRKEAER